MIHRRSKPQVRCWDRSRVPLKRLLSAVPDRSSSVVQGNPTPGWCACAAEPVTQHLLREPRSVISTQSPTDSARLPLLSSLHQLGNNSGFRPSPYHHVLSFSNLGFAFVHTARFRQSLGSSIVFCTEYSSAVISPALPGQPEFPKHLAAAATAA